MNQHSRMPTKNTPAPKFAYATVQEWLDAQKAKTNHLENLPKLVTGELVPRASWDIGVPIKDKRKLNKLKALLPPKPSFGAAFSMANRPRTSDLRRAKEILAEVAALHDLPVDLVCDTKIRAAYVVRARQHACYEVVMRIERMTYAELGRMLGAHHTTIIHAVLREAERRERSRHEREHADRLRLAHEEYDPCSRP